MIQALVSACRVLTLVLSWGVRGHFPCLYLVCWMNRIIWFLFVYFCLFLLLCAKWGTCHISPKFAEPSINSHKDENVFQVADGWVEREGQADLMLLDNSCPAGRGQCCHFWEEYRGCGLWENCCPLFQKTISLICLDPKFPTFTKHKRNSACPRLRVCVAQLGSGGCLRWPQTESVLLVSASSWFWTCSDMLLLVWVAVKAYIYQ